MSTPDLFLGIDPGPYGARHGWAVLRCPPGLPASWVSGGHHTAEEILRELGAACAWLRAVAVETAAGYVWQHYKGADLLSMNRAAGHLQGRLEALGLEVFAPASQDWRRVICGKAAAGDDRVSRAVRMHVIGVPDRALVHELDAAGAALAVARGWRPVPEQIRLAQLEGKRRTKAAKRKAGGK